MDLFLTLLISGLVSGALYSVYGTGITLLYSTTGIYNFAYGAIAFLVDLLFYELVVGAQLNSWLAAVISVLVFAPLVGLVLDRIAFRAMAGGSEVPRLVGSIGLLIGLPALGLFVVSKIPSAASVQQLALVPGIGPSPATVYSPISGLNIDSNQLIMLGVAFFSAVLLWYLVARTRLGLEMRGLVDRRSMAELRGISADRPSRAAWAIGSLLAGLVGVVGGPLFGLSIVNAVQFVVVSSAVVVLARYRSLPIAFVGGLLLGAGVSLIAGYGQQNATLARAFRAVPGLATAPTYIVLFVGLMLLGQTRGRVAGVSNVEQFVPDFHTGLPFWRRHYVGAIAMALLIVWTLGIVPLGQFGAGPVYRALIINGLCLAFVYLSFTVVTGIGGMISLGQAAFVTSGSLVAGYIVGHHVLGGNFIAGLVLGSAISALLGLIFAIPAIRLGSVSLALATIALALIGDNMLFQVPSINNGGDGWILRRPGSGWFNFHSDRNYLILVLVLLGGAVFVVSNLSKSAAGRAMYAVRDSAPAAASSGTSAVKTKLSIFAVSSGLAGMGGVLLAYSNGTANQGIYSATTGLLWLAIAATWGVRRPASAIIAGVVGAILPHVISSGVFFIPGTTNLEIPSILFGLGAVQLARTPDGIMAEFGLRNHERRLKRQARAATPVEPAEGDLPSLVQQEPAEVDKITPAGGPTGPRTSVGLSIQQLYAGYDGLHVLHGIDLDIEPGKIVALVGANGAGKSTLCSAVAGAIPTEGGRILLDGVDVSGRPVFKRAAEGIVLAPESRGIFPGLSVEDNLAIWLAEPKLREAVYDRFPIIRERQKLPASSLSGGEQQMLCIAPLLVRPPRVLIADEPTLGLAPRAAELVFSLLSELREQGVALLIVEERARAVLEVADHVAFLRRGRIAWQGPPSEISDADTVARYLGEADVEVVAVEAAAE